MKKIRKKKKSDKVSTLLQALENGKKFSSSDGESNPRLLAREVDTLPEYHSDLLHEMRTRSFYELLKQKIQDEDSFRIPLNTTYQACM